MGSVQRWRKINEPLFPCVEERVWDRLPSAPHVMLVGDRLRMYYHARQGSAQEKAPFFPGRSAMRAQDGSWAWSVPLEDRIRIGFAEANADAPLTWEKFPDNPVLDVGPVQAIDSHWASYPWVVPVTDTHWHMYYATFGGEYLDEARTSKLWRTSIAESDDAGLTWKRTGRPLFELGRPGAPDAHGSGSCAVCKVGDAYWMWYTAVYKPKRNWYRISVALATSTDGGHTFTPHPAGALLNLPPRIGYPGSTCSKPFVEYDGKLFRMWFSCAKDELYRIAYAESQDGVHFNWDPDPVLDVSPSGWDQEMTCYPSVLHVGGRTLMFYAGNNYANIGIAELVTAID